MDPGVKAAVSEAYRVFSPYSFGPYSFGACAPAGRDGNALGPLEARLLRLTPVNEIPAALLAAHAASLTGPVEGTDADDLRALLPRYFELIAAEGFPLSGWGQNALRGLAATGYRTRWPPEEVGALDRILAALLELAVTRGTSGDMAAIRALLADASAETMALHQEL